MTIDKAAAAELLELERVLDAFGADESRWPAAAQVRLRPLLSTNPGARAMAAEARALDQTLGQALAVPARDHDRLAGDIMAAIARETAMPRVDNVVPITAAAARRTPQPVVGRDGPLRWAAVMAASLVLGVTVGIATDVGSSIQNLAEAIGLGDFNPITLVYNDDQGGLDEDAL